MQVAERRFRPQFLVAFNAWLATSGGLAAVDVSDFAGDLGIHPDSSAGVLDGQ